MTFFRTAFFLVVALLAITAPISDALATEPPPHECPEDNPNGGGSHSNSGDHKNARKHKENNNDNNDHDGGNGGNGRNNNNRVEYVPVQAPVETVYVVPVNAPVIAVSTGGNSEPVGPALAVAVPGSGLTVSGYDAIALAVSNQVSVTMPEMPGR